MSKEELIVQIDAAIKTLREDRKNGPIIIMSPEDIEKMNSTEGMIFVNPRYGASINLVTGEAMVFPWCICNKCRFNPSKSRLAWCSDYPCAERYCWKFREKEESDE